VFGLIEQGNDIPPYAFLVGFAGAWLAFSGLESISQLSPAMRSPIRPTAPKGMSLVVLSILLTSPLLSLFSVALLPDAIKLHETERFISKLGVMWGGMPVELAVVGTASVLLLFAANTGIIGAYHVFLALAEGGFLPQLVTWRNRRFRTPHMAIVITTLIPVSVVLATDAELGILGDMYVFGLLGAFVMFDWARRYSLAARPARYWFLDRRTDDRDGDCGVAGKHCGETNGDTLWWDADCVWHDRLGCCPTRSFC
jgi:amino acid transporter